MIHVLVLLYAGESGGDGLSDFEARVVPIVREHGGALLSAFVPRPTDQGRRTPDEIHLLQFPSDAAFEAYRSDARHAELRELRNAVIVATEVFVSSTLRDY